MRKILKVAKLELSILFYSPVAWLVLAIFMAQCAFSFLESMQSIQTSLSMGYQTRPITGSLFAQPVGLFVTVQGTLYLYLPILTMGLMSRETSSGSIKLLLSSPVKLRQIILGKYLAIIIYALALIGILCIYALIGSLFIAHADIGMIASGLLGLYLLVCTYAAIGLFMSCLTTYQVVAAISTLAVFAVLRYVGSIGQEYDFIRDLTYFLSISGRTESMVEGMITTKDVFYYVIIIAFFLWLCILRLKTQRELKPWTVKAGRYVALFCAALMLGYITSRPVMTGYLDATSGQSLTISKNSQDIAHKIKGELKVTTYANMLDNMIFTVLPQFRNYDLGLLEQYKRFIPGMTFDYVYYYKIPVDSNFRMYRWNPLLKGVTDVEKIAATESGSMGVDSKIFIPPAQINKIIDLEPEGNMLIRTVEYNGKRAIIRFFPMDNPQTASEAEVMGAIKTLLVGSPKVIFLTGNNERSIMSQGDRDYASVSAKRMSRGALINQGFTVDTVDLNNQDIPADAGIVVLGDPTVPFTPAAQEKITSYINKGGNMLITGEPGRQAVLNPVLQSLGVQLKAGELVMPYKNETPGFLKTRITPNAPALDSNLARLQQGGFQVPVQGAAAIDMPASGSFKVAPLLMSGDSGWNKASLLDPAAAVIFDAAAGDVKGVFTVAVTLTRDIQGKQQRIVVSGDADVISNEEVARERSRFNGYFAQGVFRWLDNGVFPVDVTGPDAKDRNLKVSREQISMLSWLCKGIIPAVLLILGAITLFKRRRK